MRGVSGRDGKSSGAAVATPPIRPRRPHGPAREFPDAITFVGTSFRSWRITLSSGGVAKATRGEGMTGTWKEEGNAAVITWKTGWTTKITNEGGKYKKTAYRKGQALDAPPANSSDAERAK